MAFPTHRLRRLRENPRLRDMVRETSLSVDNLIYPLFVCEGKGIQQPIISMPGQFRFSLDRLANEVREVQQLNIPAVILFGVPDYKDAEGSAAWQADGIIQRAIKVVKEYAPKLCVIADTCFCQYTDTGHCGIIKDGRLENDQTVELIARTALSQAVAGADIVAPSGMIDGAVGAIRTILDKNNFERTPILAYAAKYASAFYGPFREAAQGPPKFGDRSSYQMDCGNSREAMREIALDLEEGADMIMIKPALPYLDIIYRARQTFDVPIAAYNVSGEYAIIKAAAQNEWINGQRVMLETLTSIRRAGADMILTYFAKEVAQLFNETSHK